MLVVVGMSHRTAPLGVRERLAIPREGLAALLQSLVATRPVAEAMVLSTCNRVEVYAAPRAGVELDHVAAAVAHVLGTIGGEGAAAHLLQNHGTQAVRHLFRVAASLDSLVVGEPQILGQLKDAIEVAREGRTLGHVLEKAVRRAVRVGKRVRTETAIGEGQVSVSSVAVERARLIFGDLSGHQALLVGAGEMAEAAAKLLVREGARLSVVNRSPERAAALAMDVGGVPRAWSELDRCLVEADVVISSTSSPDHVITLSLVKAARKARRGRELFLIDIAVPRDVDPAVNDLDGVYLYDVDDLSQIVASSMEGRAASVTRAEEIVAEAASAFERWTLERALTPTIVGLRARTRAVLVAEVERSLAGKLRHLGQSERAALLAMIDAATNKLMHAPTVRLRGAASDPRSADYIEALRELFELPDVSSEPDALGATEGELGGDTEGDEGDEEAVAVSGRSSAPAGQARGA